MYNDLSHTYAIIKWFKDQEYVMKEKYSTRFWLEIGDATLDGIDRITEKKKQTLLPLNSSEVSYEKLNESTNLYFYKFLDIIHIQEK